MHRTVNLPLAVVAIVSVAVITGCSSPAASITAPSAIDGVTTAALHTPVPCDHDTLGPTISGAVASPGTMWPPNHKWWTIRVSYTLSDNCGGTVTSSLSVVSDEPVNGLGDGNTAPDWEVLDAHTVRLRAERSGTGDGRIYTITITAVDASGNATTAAVNVTVVHDQRKK